MSNNIVVFSNNNDQIEYGGIVWTPSVISTAAWFDASDSSTITIDGSNKVSDWLDKSGNDNHATQVISSEQPTYVSSDSLANNKGSLTSSGSDYVGMDTPSFSARQIYAIMYYKTGVETTFGTYHGILSNVDNYKNTSPLTRNYRIIGNSGSNSWLTTNRFNDNTYVNATTSSSNIALPMPLTMFRFRSSDIRTQAFSLGRHNEVSNRSWHGGYSEFIFTDGTEDLDTQQKIEGYLAHKWGISSSLPSDHPYKGTRPYV